MLILQRLGQLDLFILPLINWVELLYSTQFWLKTEIFTPFVRFEVYRGCLTRLYKLVKIKWTWIIKTQLFSVRIVIKQVTSKILVHRLNPIVQEIRLQTKDTEFEISWAVPIQRNRWKYEVLHKTLELEKDEDVGP